MSRALALSGVLVAAWLLSPATVSAQQVGGRGFSVLLCVAEQGGSLPGGAQVNYVIDSDTGPNQDGIGQAIVTINHGESSSTHVVVYEDTNPTGGLNCGDRVISVT